MTFRTGAHKFLRRAVVTCANNEVQLQASEYKRANLEAFAVADRAFERRKPPLLLCVCVCAGGGPSPPSRRPGAGVPGLPRPQSEAMSTSQFESMVFPRSRRRRADPRETPGVRHRRHEHRPRRPRHRRPPRPTRHRARFEMGVTTRAAHDSVDERGVKSSDDDSYDDDGVIVFQTPEQQTSRPSTRGSSRHTASGGENDWTHVSAPVSPPPPPPLYKVA